MARRIIGKLNLDALNLANDEVWERVEQVAQAVSGELLTAAPRSPSKPTMWIDRENGLLKVQFPDGTIETWSKD